MALFKIWTDGGSRGNPGPSGIGCVILSPESKVLLEISEYIGVQTNNYAEYTAMIIALERAINLNIKNIEVFLDSKLVVEQMNGNWKVKNEDLQVLYNHAKELVKSFQVVTFNHVPRSLNKHSDSLANKAMDSISFNLTID